jgi:hypothetical protein
MTCLPTPDVLVLISCMHCHTVELLPQSIYALHNKEITSLKFTVTMSTTPGVTGSIYSGMFDTSPTLFIEPE